MKTTFEFTYGIGVFVGYKNRVLIIALPFVAVILDMKKHKVEEKKHRNKYRNAFKK